MDRDNLDRLAASVKHGTEVKKAMAALLASFEERRGQLVARGQELSRAQEAVAQELKSLDDEERALREETAEAITGMRHDLTALMEDAKKERDAEDDQIAQIGKALEELG